MNNQSIMRTFCMLLIVTQFLFSCHDIKNNNNIDKKTIGDTKCVQNIEYYSNGVIKAKYEYKDGKKNGKFVRYYPDESVLEYGTFVNDKLEGYVYAFSESGDTASITRFHEGNLLEFVRYKSGKKSMKADHVDNTFTRYDCDGKIIDVSPL